MVASIKIELDDLEARAALAGLEARAGDFSPLFVQFGMLLEGSARNRIENSNLSPDGIEWPVSLRVKEFGGKTLRDSGELAASLTHQPERMQVVIGSNLIYAGVHQDGAEIFPKDADALGFRLPNGQFVTVGKVTIPARPYLGVSSDDAEDMIELTKAYLLEPIRAQQ